MSNQDLAGLANIPLARPGFDALDMSAPVLVQLNPNGRWENSKPETLDEDRLKAVVHHLVNSRALSAAQSYCCQCAAANQIKDGAATSAYVPIIMMPIYPADQCPFDMESEDQMKQTDTKPKKKATSAEKAQDHDSKADKDKKKVKKRVFTLQRLTDFDLLSQW